jgi:hypothetical protein
MRFFLCLSAVLLLSLGLWGLPAQAKDQGASPELRRTQQRIAVLEHELRMARLQSQSDRAWAKRLYEFVADCLRRLAEQGTVVEIPNRGQAARVEALEGEVRRVTGELRAEQERHASDVYGLQAALQKAHTRLEQSHVERLRAKKKAEVDTRQIALSKKRAESEAKKAQAAHQELERVRWVFTRGAPAGSVARVLADIPASHWQREARSKTVEEARVALLVLAVLPDRNAATIETVLLAAHTHGQLLDRATPILVRIGAPAVPALVAAGRGKEAATALDRGWVMHVLGKMGSAAAQALPWLDEVAQGDGREAQQAGSAIEKIR